MKPSSKTSKYYNGDELLSRHYMINMVCGSRFGGKSTWAQRYVLKRAIQSKGKSQFALVFRDVDQLAGETAMTYFNNTLLMWYPDFEIAYKRNCYYLHNKKTDEMYEVGHAFAIKRATKMKSSSFPLIDTVILEEFINLEGKYIKSVQEPDLEVKMFISLLQTVLRGNGEQFKSKARVLCISNAYSLDNPYFRYFKVIDYIVQNPFKRFYEFKEVKDKKGAIITPAVFIERVDNDIDDGFGSDNAGSRWTDFRNELHIAKVDKIKNSKVVLQLTFDNKKILNIARWNEEYIVFKGDKRIQGCNAFSCSEIKKEGYYHVKLWHAAPSYKVIDGLFAMNKLWYDSLETYITMYAIMSF